MHPIAQKLQNLATAARLAGNHEAGIALAEAAAVVDKARELVTVKKTLRDGMAMTALGGLLAQNHSRTAEQLAGLSYELADAMLNAREA